MGGIVGMAVIEVGDHGGESIEHIQVGAWIEIGGGDGGGGVSHKDAAQTIGHAPILDDFVDHVGNINHLLVLAGFDSDSLHDNLSSLV
jgi:hypothetical protein